MEKEIKQEFNEKIRNRMLVRMLFTTAIVLVVLGCVLYVVSLNIIEKQATQQVIAKLARASERMDFWLQNKGIVVNSMALVLSHQDDLSSENISTWLTEFAEKNNSKAGFVGLENGDYIDPAWTPEADYDHKTRSWYQETRTLKKLHFTTPYIDGDTGKVVLSCTAPIFKNGVFLGVVGIDVFPGNVLDYIRDSAEETEYQGIVVDSKGRYIIHPQEEFIMKKRVQDSHMALDYEKFIKKHEPLVISGEEEFYAFWPIRSADWTALFTLNRSVVNRPVRHLAMFFMFGAIIALVVLGFMIEKVGQILTKPILSLADGAEKITHGDYDYRVQVVNHDEIGFLSHSFNQMASGLNEREKIRSELVLSKAEQAKLEGEMQAGQRIQMAMLPQDFIQSESVNLYAIYKSAKEVGGDFYNFFELSDGRIAFMIGDVSGKGVAAALFMALTSMSLKISCSVTNDPATALSATNDILSAHNEQCMFATIFMCYFDPSNNECVFANAGHNPPMILSEDGSIEYFSQVEGIAVGFQENMKYTSKKMILGPGQSIVLYTDGITEAHSPDKELYGEERLEKLLSDNKGASVQELCEKTQDAVMEFQKDKQFDDISMLVFKRT